MKKILIWLSDNILYLYTLFLLAFIPLYPKLPLVDIRNTWVYIRADDLAIALGVLLLGIQLIRKKATLKTPLTLPILIFWIIGTVSTVFAIFFIFPILANVFPNLAVLHLLRRVEYLSVFFIAFSAIRTKKQLYGVLAVLTTTLFVVVGYGLGQRYLGFHAFLTMNEEFAKGTPLQLSALARIPSTFAGHYDLAAYLVMVIAITGAMVVGFKNIFLKILFLFASASGLILLLMTASRVSFAVYLVTVAFLLIIQKKKLLIIPVIVASILLANTFEGISERFASTISQADVIVDARTGKAVGIAKEVTDETGKKRIVIDEEESTGEDLPQGSGYINVPSKGVEGGQTIYKRDSEGRILTTLNGDFVVKKAFAYDVSFTTRLQGTWPRALDAFKRNFLLGSGYSSINVASDGNYLRILGEIGSLGFLAFGSIFLVYGIYVYRLISDVKSRVAKHFILGVSAGIFGLALNAVLIDVFEASKVAYLLWMLIGISLATIWLYKKQEVNILHELRDVLTSIPAILIYFFIAAIVIFWSSLSNYFVSDDFIWLRWAGDCRLTVPQLNGQCPSILQLFATYFTDAQGFFYRPGTKIYFYIMHAIFWLSPVMYHVASIFLHAMITSVVFLLSKKLYKSKLFAFILAVLFLTLAAHFEALFWISVTGHLVAFLSVMLALLFFAYYHSGKNILFLILSFVFIAIAPFFHEFGVVGPLLIVTLSVTSAKEKIYTTVKKMWKIYLPFLLLIPGYLYLRISAGSAGFQGDYDYNLVKLPVNILGNTLGYLMYMIFGRQSLTWYQSLRASMRDDIPVMMGVAVLVAVLIIAVVYFAYHRIQKETRKHIAFGILFFIIAMAPFLGLGNIAERYIYFGSFGILFLFVLLLKYLFQRIYGAHAVAAYVILAITVAIIAAANISALQRLNRDWQKAGSITKSTIDEFGYYAAFFKKELNENTIYYLVNVPKRVDSAWVFALGVEDAIWFTTQNEDIDVRQGATMQEALEFKASYPQTRIFEFDAQGMIHPLLEE